MSIFGTYLEENFNDFDMDDFDNEVLPTEESLYNIMIEGAGEIYKTVGALYISDVIMEESMILEEGVMDTLKAAKDKVVAAFKKLWKKIKDWFTAVIKNIGILFTSSKKFIEKYREDINKKIKALGKLEAKSGSKYNVNANKVIKTTRDNLIKSAANVVVKIEKGKGKNAGKAETLKEDILKGVNTNYSSITDLKNDLIKKCVTKYENAVTYSKEDLNNMVAFLTNATTDVSDVRDLFSKTSDLIQTAIKKVKNAKTADEIAANSTAFNTAVAYVNSISPIAVKIIESRNKHSVAVLKALLYKNSIKKESFELSDYEDLEESNSVDDIFATAYDLI